MYLKEWRPVFEKAFGGMHVGDVTLHLEAELECPSCKAVEVAKTKSHCSIWAVHTKKGIDMLLGWKINELVQHRGCAKCGIVSTLPQADQERLWREAREQITAQRILLESSLLHLQLRVA